VQDHEVPSRGDDPDAIRDAASGALLHLVALAGTAASVRAQWLDLAEGYRAAEAGHLLRAMDRPAEVAGDLLRTGWALHRALTDYADRLAWIDTWDHGPGQDPRAAPLARLRAEQECAAAIAALVCGDPRFGILVTPAATTSQADRSAAGQPTEPRASVGRPGGAHRDRPTGEARHRWPGHPGSGEDLVHRGLSSLEATGVGAAAYASWMVSVEHGTFRPRAASGRFVAPGSLTPAQRLRAGTGRFSTAAGLGPMARLRSFEPGGNVVAKAHRRAAHARWSRTAAVLGRANTGVTVAGVAWSQWQRDAGEATDRRIGRTATRTATTAGGAWAGGQAGAWAGGAVGTAVLPGAGTVIGATVGAALGGMAGSEAGSWVGGHLQDAGADAGEAMGDGAGWVVEHASELGDDVVETLAFWT